MALKTIGCPGFKEGTIVDYPRYWRGIAAHAHGVGEVVMVEKESRERLADEKT
jgi:hypothetical protein